MCVVLGMAVWSLLLFCTRDLTFVVLRFTFNQSAADRSITTERFQADSDREADFADTKEWAENCGGQALSFDIPLRKNDGIVPPAYTISSPKRISRVSVVSFPSRI